MRHLVGRLALVLIPVYLWFAFFVCFEPNNYFGLKAGTDSSQPVAKVRAYQQSPGSRLILGDSRLAHLDDALVQEVSGRDWQNLAFGGASLRETLDLADYVLDSGNPLEALVLEVSFYTLNAHYDTDRFSALETTLQNPLAYCLNLEYNVNAATCFADRLRGATDAIESGVWGPEDYFDSAGEPIPVHRILYEYTDLIAPRCSAWQLGEQWQRLPQLAARCRERGVALTVVLPPMAARVRSESCVPYGIEQAMLEEVLPQLAEWARQYDFALLDYEWGGSCITDDDSQFYDGFHLDELYGLPQWTRQLFGDIAVQDAAA